MTLVINFFKRNKTPYIFTAILFLLFSISIKAQSISTDTISGSPFCACTNIKVSFNSIGLFNPGNIFKAQLSDPAGNFATPVTIGLLVSVANKDTMTCILPCNALNGTKYRIRVVSSDTSLIGSDNGADITINASVADSVHISASDTTICPGDPTLFTAKAINAGKKPRYQWKVNGVNVGTDSTKYLALTLNNGDKVCVVMISDTLCAIPTPIVSDTITMIVKTPIPAKVFIIAIDTTAICANDPLVFVAIPTGGGSNPSYQWKLNGVNVGTNAPFYVADSLKQGDKVNVIMTSNSSCASGSPATSNTLTIDIVTSITPTVKISASATTICSGDLVTFNATPKGGGVDPKYQWKINGVNVGTDSSGFSSFTLKNGDVVTVVMTSSMSCASPTTATSNSKTMTVTTSVTALVSVSSNLSGAVCVGQSVTFTATPTNGGTAPVYQWQVNGVNVGANSPIFTISTLTTGDVVTVIMTSNAKCTSNSPVTSSPITMTVSTTITPSVSIWPSPTETICAGSLAGFIATPNGGGLTPMYQWKVNGINVGAPTSSRVFTSTTLNNGDSVSVDLISSMPCASPTTVTSNHVGIIIGSSIPITVNSSTICRGETATLTAIGGITYLWNNGATTTSISVTPPSTATYTVTGTTSGCSGSATATVTVNPAPAVTASSASICVGGSAILTAGGGTTYLWSTGETTTSITVTPGTTTSYTVTGTTGGCTGTAVATVSIITTLTITVNSPSICAGTTATLTANNGTTYLWSTGQTINPITVSPATTASYTVVGTSGTCTASAIATVSVVTILPVAVNSPAVCPGQNATLTATGATNYLWSTGQTANPITVLGTPSSYTVTGTSGTCSGSAIAIVSIASATPVSINGNLVINACEKTTLTALPTGNSYAWGPNVSCSNCQSVTVSPPATQQYYVNYTDAKGCSAGDTVTVQVTTLNTYFLPTALSPNGDGINDEIHFHGRGIDSFTLRIFDRIGEKVFETSDMDKGWDGRLLGVPMNDAVFVYTLNIKFCNDEQVSTKGAITLVK